LDLGILRVELCALVPSQEIKKNWGDYRHLSLFLVCGEKHHQRWQTTEGKGENTLLVFSVFILFSLSHLFVYLSLIHSKHSLKLFPLKFKINSSFESIILGRSDDEIKDANVGDSPPSSPPIDV
jgi:hypothetical protein